MSPAKEIKDAQVPAIQLGSLPNGSFPENELADRATGVGRKEPVGRLLCCVATIFIIGGDQEGHA